MGFARRSAFTIVELAAVTVAAGVGGAMCTLVLGPVGSEAQPERESQPTPVEKAADPKLLKQLQDARTKARQTKDEMHVRGIVQSMHIWANVNQDKFPLPSEVDTGGTTVAGPNEAKDTTANILSMLIFTGGISTELCVSPAEVSANIEIDSDYMYDQPKTAVKPAAALWDPAFTADFTGGKKGNDSYAHVQPAASRGPRWTNTFISLEPVWGNRGPKIEKIETDAQGKRTAKVADPNTLTYLIHGERTSWEGHIGYNDGHVKLEKSLLPDYDVADKKWATFQDKDGKEYLDCYFFDEPEDAEGKNVFMGIFTKSAKETKNWEAIWD